MLGGGGGGGFRLSAVENNIKIGCKQVHSKSCDNLIYINNNNLHYESRSDSWVVINEPSAANEGCRLFIFWFYYKVKTPFGALWECLTNSEGLNLK